MLMELLTRPMLSFFHDARWTLCSAWNRHHLPHSLVPRYSKYGLQNSNISIAWETVRNAESQDHARLLNQKPPFHKTSLCIIHNKYSLPWSHSLHSTTFSRPTMVNILKPAGYFNYTQTLLPLIFFLLSFFIFSSSFLVFSYSPSLPIVNSSNSSSCCINIHLWLRVNLSLRIFSSNLNLLPMLLQCKLSFSFFFSQKLNIILQFDDKSKTSLYKDRYYWASESNYMEWDAIFLTIHGMI